MLDRSEAALDRVFQALAHPTRRAILRQISREEQTVTALAEPFDVTLEAVSQHIRVLERAGLVKRTRRGREYHCRFQPTPLKRAAKTLATLAQYWTERLDGLEAYLTSGEDA